MADSVITIVIVFFAYADKYTYSIHYLQDLQKSYTKNTYKYVSIFSGLKRTDEVKFFCIVIRENVKRSMNNEGYIFATKIQYMQEVYKSCLLKCDSSVL